MKKEDFRKRFNLILLIAIIVSLAPAWSCRAEERTAGKTSESVAVLKELGSAFVEVANNLKPSVVSIRVERTVTVTPWRWFGEDFFRGTPFEDFFRSRPEPPTRRRQIGGGSGVIVDPGVYILTNNHVVAGAEKITIRLSDGRELKGTVQGTDPKTDLAVVRVEARNLPVARLGNSDKIEVGEWAIAIGSPFGLAETVTVGVISAKHRAGLGTGTYEDFIQTDASINPGNSGGPLVNIDGEVIGINAMIIQPGQGIGFAIPINLAKKIMADLIERGRVIRPWVGIGLQDLTEELARSFDLKEAEGALISQVHEGSPAEKAGFKPGDIIVEMDGEKVENSQGLVNKVLEKKVGQKIRFTVLRDGKRIDVSVTTVEMPSEPEEREEALPEEREWFGLRVTTVTPEIAKQLGLAKAEGVIIEDVAPGSLAGDAGLMRGDVILEVNRRKVRNEEDYLKAMKDVKPDQGALFLINRRGATFFVTLRETK